MAKIKISELATELGCEGKALLSFLQDKGIEAKRSNSSIDDNEAEIQSQTTETPVRIRAGRRGIRQFKEKFRL